MIPSVPTLESLLVRSFRPTARGLHIEVTARAEPSAASAPSLVPMNLPSSQTTGLAFAALGAAMLGVLGVFEYLAYLARPTR